MSSIVRAIAYGPLLENSLDEKLGRPKHQMLMQNVSSAILNDPDFAPSNAHIFNGHGSATSDDEGAEAETSASASSVSNVTSHTALMTTFTTCCV